MNSYSMLIALQVLSRFCYLVDSLIPYNKLLNYNYLILTAEEAKG